jgi:uncharacterized protein (TIGR03435 family)
LSLEDGIQRLSAGGSPISSLVTWLQLRLDRPIIDRTGLVGAFSMRLQFAPNTTLRATTEPGVQPGQEVGVFTAVREQLGLSLEPQKSSMDVLVIDHIELPTAN